VFAPPCPHSRYSLAYVHVFLLPIRHFVVSIAQSAGASSSKASASYRTGRKKHVPTGNFTKTAIAARPIRAQDPEACLRVQAEVQRRISSVLARLCPAQCSQRTPVPHRCAPSRLGPSTWPGQHHQQAHESVSSLLPGNKLVCPWAPASSLHFQILQLRLPEQPRHAEASP
jgi:hypothetical protein